MQILKSVGAIAGMSFAVEVAVYWLVVWAAKPAEEDRWMFKRFVVTLMIGSGIAGVVAALILAEMGK